MKLTAKKLKQIITEELKQTIGESFGNDTEEDRSSIDWQRDQEDAERQAASQDSQREHELRLEAALNAFMKATDGLGDDDDQLRKYDSQTKNDTLKFVEEYLFEEWQREKK